MLAYTLPEAETLLDSKLEAAQSSASNCEEDLDFLREQITVCVPSAELWIFREMLADRCTDHGGSNGTSLQLGRRRAKEGKV